jgi:hypothetical protein
MLLKNLGCSALSQRRDSIRKNLEYSGSGKASSDLARKTGSPERKDTVFSKDIAPKQKQSLLAVSTMQEVTEASYTISALVLSFLSFQTAHASGGVEALFDVSKRKPNIKNRVEEETERAVIEYAIEFLAHGQTRTSNELRKKGGILIRMLTDRSTEFCGKLETHDYQLFLGINGIEHTKTKARHPQTNGICERFHKTILQEVYQAAFRHKFYALLEELQAYLEVWLNYDNTDRTHQGKVCCGRTPMQILLDGKSIWRDKVEQLN